MRALLFLLFIASGCGDPNIPLDATARRRVDSLAAVGVGLARQQQDSICREQRITLLPVLIDSIKQERIRAIQAQLNQIPQ